RYKVREAWWDRDTSKHRVCAGGSLGVEARPLQRAAQTEHIMILIDAFCCAEQHFRAINHLIDAVCCPLQHFLRIKMDTRSPLSGGERTRSGSCRATETSERARAWRRGRDRDRGDRGARRRACSRRRRRKNRRLRALASESRA